MRKESTPWSEARAWVEVDLGALVRNARALAAHAKVPLVPMVKADAYGLGAVRVAQALEVLEPFGYGVSSIDEGVELRDAGITRPIIHYTPWPIEAAMPDGPADVAEDSALGRALMRDITPTLSTARDIEIWSMLSRGAPYHLAIDSGMHRAGAGWDAIDVRLLGPAALFPPEAILTHFHSSEKEDGSLALQESRFREVLAAYAEVREEVRRNAKQTIPAVRQHAEFPRFAYVDNSGSIVRRSPSPWDLVRPGVFLYGVGSGPGAALQPEPVASLRARILEIRTVAPGEGVSYGGTWRAERETRLATVACGYADGLRRQLGNRAHALVKGRRAPIRGVVTMDMAMLDVTGIPCEIGDVATFLGRDGDELLTAESVAAAGDLSPYELLVGLKLRLPRFYVDS